MMRTRWPAAIAAALLLGTGGIAAELHRDVTLALAPVTLTEARAMIGRVKGMRLLAGWRGLPEGDLEALAAAIVAVSRLAARTDVAEAEINPLIIRPAGQGVVLADAWVVRA